MRNLPSLRFSVRLLFGGSRYFAIDLSSRYRRYVGPARTALVLLCALLGGWIVWSMVQTAVTLSNLQEASARLDQALEQDRQLLQRVQREGIDLSARVLQQLPAEVALANQLLLKRNFSWTQFLSGLEEAIPPAVAIKSVRLDPSSATIHLTGVAATVEDITGLALKLQTHRVFRDPVLGQHHAATDGLVEFDLTLKYHPQGA